ncbi:MAG: recombinase [uncultured bacterium]|nr:MAG: recombinase [uncultured bacterium]
MKAIILARVSTEEQKEAGNSLPAQIERLENYCKRKGFDVVKNLSFDESAYKSQRSDFEKIITDIKTYKEKVVVCFDKVDRFSRNVFDKSVSVLYEMAMADRIELHFASDNLIINSKISATEKFHFGINLNLAKYYSDAISDNVKRAYEQKLRNGEWINKAPLGYKSITLENGTKSVIIDPDKHFFIKELFELYASGKYSMKTLAKEMKEKGLTNNRTNTPISTSQVEQILKNPFYYGVMKTNGKLYPHKYEPIIPLNLYNKAHEVINSYNKQNFKRTGKPYIFRGLVKCQECGCSISPEIKKGKYIYYHCTNYHGNCGNVVWIKEEALLKQIEPTLKGLKLTAKAINELKRELRATHEMEKIHYEQNTNAIKKKIESIENKLKIMYEDRLDGRLTPEDYDEKVKECKIQKKDLLEEYGEHVEADENFCINANKILSLASRAWEIFESSEAQEKTQLLKFTLQNFSLTGKNLSFEAKIPFSGILEYANSGSMLRDQDSNLEPIDYTYPNVSIRGGLYHLL